MKRGLWYGGSLQCFIFIFLLISSAWEISEPMEMELNPSSNINLKERGVEEREYRKNKG